MSAAALSADKPTLITGGAGFIGSNLAHRLLQAGEQVVLLDNLSRASVARNVDWLIRLHGSQVALIVADIRDAAQVAAAVAEASQVFHFAAQVAVTGSLLDPVADFEINARGTLNVLEALRATPASPPLVFTSTNKVYGALTDLPLTRRGRRIEPVDGEIARAGLSEARPLDFHSPYGCSKGAADQYVLDYARTFGIDATALRMSCMYGPRQFGNEDQGWVAHFLIRAIQGEPITIYGDGAQVRDVLFIDDLVDALLLARTNIHALAGSAFNIGGGPSRAVSLLDVLELIEELEGRRPRVSFAAPRPGDQLYYVSDCRRFSARTGWSPRVSVREGVERLRGWIRGASLGATPEGATAEVAR